MKKLFIIVLALLMLSGQCFGINDWVRGDGSDCVKGTGDPSDIDTDVTNYMQDPLDRLLSDYIYGCTLTWASNSTITVGIGNVTCLNGAGTIKRMRKNTATTTLDMTVVGVGGIDSGSGVEAASTWYNLYAVADANATTFTVICGKNGTALSDVTYYRKIGRFYNNSGSNITAWTVEDSEGEIGFGAWTSTDIDGAALIGSTVYQAATDGYVVAYASRAAPNSAIQGYTDAANPPTTVVAYSGAPTGYQAGITMPVRKGDYWKVVPDTTLNGCYWIPLIHTKK